ncbi:unnamed protein product [Cyprideis torosa]|uniref:Uncharacterized protein n=1 Tax=Cyprideis torosa TaxID=163714 RepID=A0A7R8W007_9CRUS|nr:unnamed protein product [Cyprideis torosa]CAG0879243.1 unnamed protein product [Cyprideis torosa]
MAYPLIPAVLYEDEVKPTTGTTGISDAHDHQVNAGGRVHKSREAVNIEEVEDVPWWIWLIGAIAIFFICTTLSLIGCVGYLLYSRMEEVRENLQETEGGKHSGRYLPKTKTAAAASGRPKEAASDRRESTEGEEEGGGQGGGRGGEASPQSKTDAAEGGLFSRFFRQDDVSEGVAKAVSKTRKSGMAAPRAGVKSLYERGGKAVLPAADRGGETGGSKLPDGSQRGSKFYEHSYTSTFMDAVRDFFKGTGATGIEEVPQRWDRGFTGPMPSNPMPSNPTPSNPTPRTRTKPGQADKDSPMSYSQ